MGLNTAKLVLPLGGEASRFDPGDLAPDEALYMRDLLPSLREAALVQRPGFSQLNTSTPRAIINVFGWRYGPNTSGVVQTDDAAVYKLDAANAIDPTPLSVAAGGYETWQFEGYHSGNTSEPRLYALTSPTTPPVVWDGSASSFSTWAEAPLNCTCIKVWRNRICLAGSGVYPHRVWYSDTNNPHSPAVAFGNNWVDLIDSSTSNTEQIRALAVAGDYLLVFKTNTVWAIYDPVSFNNRRLFDVGTIGPNTVAQCQGRVYFLTRPDRLMSTSGTDLKQECPQYQFQPGPLGVDIDFDISWDRTHLQATDDELYCLQTNGQSPSRELLYIPLRSKNQRGEWPVFRMQHTLGNANTTDQSPALPPGLRVHDLLSLGMISQYSGWGSQVTYRTYDLFAGGNAAALASPRGRLYKYSPQGAQSTADTLTIAADTIGNYWPPAQFFRRMPLQGMENLERLRRVNVKYGNGVQLDVYPEINAELQGLAPFNAPNAASAPFPNGAALLAAFSQAILQPASPTFANGFYPFRPETRGREQLIRFRKPPTMLSGMKLYEVELKYRGGKEFTSA